MSGTIGQIWFTDGEPAWGTLAGLAALEKRLQKKPFISTVHQQAPALDRAAYHVTKMITGINPISLDASLAEQSLPNLTM